MSPAAQAFLTNVKATRDEFVGLDATHLSLADRRELSRLGCSFGATRKHGQVVGHYTAQARQNDLRTLIQSRHAK